MTLGWIKAIVALAVITAVGGYMWRCEYVKEERAAFIGRLEEQAEAQRLRIIDRIKNDKLKKAVTDAKNDKTTAALLLANKRLRDLRASSSFLPAPSPTARSPQEATVLRAEFERAIQQLDGEVSRIVEEGDKARIDLDSAKEWVKE